VNDNGAKLLHAIVRARTTNSASEIPPWATLNEDERDDYRNIARLIATAQEAQR
jgi:hypothetical protein